MKRIVALLLAVMMVFCLVACGQAEPNKTEEETKTAVETKEEQKTVVIGYTDYAPMNYEDENKVLVGFDTELAKAVFDKMGYKTVFKLINWSERYTELNSGAIQCIWNGFTANSADDDGVARAEKVDFSYN